jgi:hypothetical protein
MCNVDDDDEKKVEAYEMMKAVELYPNTFSHLSSHRSFHEYLVIVTRQ